MCFWSALIVRCFSSVYGQENIIACCGQEAFKNIFSQLSNYTKLLGDIPEDYQDD